MKMLPATPMKIFRRPDGAPKGIAISTTIRLDNATGSFVTTAKLDGTNIKITVSKVYKNAFEKAEQWPDLLKMLEAASSYEELKIMFRKS